MNLDVSHPSQAQIPPQRLAGYSEKPSSKRRGEAYSSSVRSENAARGLCQPPVTATVEVLLSEAPSDEEGCTCHA